MEESTKVLSQEFYKVKFKDESPGCPKPKPAFFQAKVDKEALANTTEDINTYLPKLMYKQRKHQRS